MKRYVDKLKSVVMAALPRVGPIERNYIVKDNIATTTTTCGSHMLDTYASPFDATVVTLLNGAGYVLSGKANLDEFGMGSSTTNSYYGATINPRYLPEERIAGGSSGGSAAAVAAGLASFSLGTDTGGSVRLPASYCGVVGFKPTYGRLSRWGVVPYAQTLDTVGILANKVSVVEEVYKVLDKHDEKDPTSMPDAIRTYHGPQQRRRLVVGIPEECIVDELSEEITQSWLETVWKIQDMGHEIRPVSIPSIQQLLLAYYTIVTAEAASNLSRYDGVRYGYHGDTADTFQEAIADNRSTALGKEVQRRIILGNYTLSSCLGNHLLKATQIRKQLVEEFNGVFNRSHPLLGGAELVTKCDVLIMPTSTAIPPTIDQYVEQTTENFLQGYINDILTVPASLAGLPAISVPVGGEHDIQIMAQYGDDAAVLALATSLQALE